MISIGMLKDVWSFRNFVTGSVKRELQTRYRGTQFGAFWIVADPLAQILVYTIVFAGLMRPSLAGHDSPFAFSIYLCAGLLTWGFFAELLGRSIGIFVESGGFLKKVNFPKLCARSN